jgi:hypothetical protein
MVVLPEDCVVLISMSSSKISRASSTYSAGGRVDWAVSGDDPTTSAAARMMPEAR